MDIHYNDAIDDYVSTAFQDLANGDFKGGLAKLDKDPNWHDDRKDLNGPFCLGFPQAQGWGEDLLIASLLRRCADTSKTPVKVFADWQVCSILKHEKHLHTQQLRNDTVVRSPFVILRHTLMGNLLAKPFIPLRTAQGPLPTPTNQRLQVGIAWASISSNHPIPEKSIPLDKFLPLLKDIDADFISLQRKLKKADPDNQLCSLGVRILSDDILDTTTPSSVDTLVKEIRNLDCLVTISTTTTHIAASMGIIVKLIAAERKGQQWFWQVQASHQKCLYPSVQVHIGDGSKENWWEKPLGSVRKSLSSLKKINNRVRIHREILSNNGKK